MLVTGCGCLAVHSFMARFHGTVRLMLARNLTHLEILFGKSYCKNLNVNNCSFKGLL